MRKIIFSLLLSVIVVVAPAQVKGFGFGPRVGVNFADYENSPGSTRTGLYAGAFLDYNFTHRWGIETGAYYSQHGSKNNVEGLSPLRTTHEIDYLTVPLVAKFNFLGGFRATLGLESMFLLSANSKEEGGNTTKMDNIRSTNLGITIGAAYLLRCGLDISASYSKGFYNTHEGTDWQKNSAPYNYRVAIGWRFIGSNK